MHLLVQSALSDNRLSRIDTRVRVFCTVIAIGLVIAQRGIFFPAALFAVSSAAVLSMGIRWKHYALKLAEPFLIGLVLITIKSTGGSDPVASWQVGAWLITIHRDGMFEGLAIAMRIAASVSLLLLIAFSCPFSELLAALSWYRIPRGLIEILLFAHRSLTAMHEEASTIYQAQRNRLGYASLLQGLQSFGLLAGTLTLRAFDQSQTTAVAMVQRGYDGHLPTGDCRRLEYRDYCTGLIFIALIGALWIAI
ncbi:MAG TPA: cobalt ECF transporter T component CbiQ [Dissulfurispiraceae bacterium]|nr:cobalt ECF transporter T component CbiQ [Dissulfurispiraceae bacterium]